MDALLNSTILTPTATMAEHLRNEQARAHAPVRPNRILTLSKFLDPFTHYESTPDALLHLLIAQADLSAFADVAEFPGFHRSLATLLQEDHNLPPELARIAREIEYQLDLRGRALRAKRLRSADPLIDGPITLDGFFTFSPAELDFIEKLAAQAPVTINLPDWQGSKAAQARLQQIPQLFLNEVEQVTDLRPAQLSFFDPPSRSKQIVFAAPSLEQECEQIAIRILDYIAQGHEFRDIGIILRVRNPYGPALETTLARFGIPARFHFTDDVAAHPSTQYLSGIVRAFLSGWDHEKLLTPLRMPMFGEGDRFDFALRDQLPGSGLNRNFPEKLSLLEPWRRERVTPSEWASRLKTLRQLLPPLNVTDRAGRDQIRIWQSTAVATTAFAEALDITAVALNPAARISLADFWHYAETALSVEQLRIPDHRRNVVNVLDVYEARQWQLPIVFVCGLTERHFPQYHRENPLLKEATRPDEDPFLFELATTRATQETVLSYARYNEKGDAQLRSFFLGTAEAKPAAIARPILAPTFPAGTSLILHTEDLRVKHAKLAPTSIESFLQCPFQFFANKTLKLRQRPEKPRDRLNVLLQGSILHRALAEGELEQVFQEMTGEEKIPRTYRTEAVRLELLRHFEAFQSDTQWPLTWARRVEEKFVIPLTPELAIRGRIDRLEIGPDNQAIVIDYKYSAAAKIRERMDNPLQGGLYLLAAEREFGYQPAGMFYCGLRASVTWEGWHTAIPGIDFGESRTPAGLRELITAAEKTAIETFEAIASGNTEVRPTDTAKCRYCDFNDICRVESIPKAATAV